MRTSAAANQLDATDNPPRATGQYPEPVWKTVESRPALDVNAARVWTVEAARALERAPAFQQLDAATRGSILRDLVTIRDALDRTVETSATTSAPVEPATRRAVPDPAAFALDTPSDLFRRRTQARPGGNGAPADQPAASPGAANGGVPGPRAAATETLAARAGALGDEIDFPTFVAGLVHGTFDAIVDATIRQMEAFANLVSAVAKDVDRFTSENVTANQTRDWLAHQFPADLELEVPPVPGAGPPRLRRRQRSEDAEDQPAPDWLAEFGLADQPLTDEVIEESLIPAARSKLGESRLQMLATMVLLGMNRINVRDGTISARLRFRAAASDKAAVDYAVSSDPGGASWGSRGSAAYAQHATMVSTVGVNVQADTELKAELFGEVKINFVSETLPLERFADQARLALLQRHARWAPPLSGPPATRLEPIAPSVPPEPAEPGPAPAPIVPPASRVATPTTPDGAAGR